MFTDAEAAAAGASSGPARFCVSAVAAEAVDHIDTLTITTVSGSATFPSVQLEQGLPAGLYAIRFTDVTVRGMLAHLLDGVTVSSPPVVILHDHNDYDVL